MVIRMLSGVFIVAIPLLTSAPACGPVAVAVLVVVKHAAERSGMSAYKLKNVRTRLNHLNREIDIDIFSFRNLDVEIVIESAM